MTTNKVDEKKFVNHLLYTNAHELAKDCERWGKDEWAAKLNKVTLENAEAYLRSDLLFYLRPDLLFYFRSNLLPGLRSYLRSYLLSGLRSDLLFYLRSYLLSGLRSGFQKLFTQEYINAYIYAGGKMSSLKKSNLNLLTLENIKAEGELRQENWHTCKMVHCTGGWYVVVTHNQELEEFVGTEMAASMISLASTGSIPDFHNMDNDAALADIQARAAREK